MKIDDLKIPPTFQILAVGGTLISIQPVILESEKQWSLHFKDVANNCSVNWKGNKPAKWPQNLFDYILCHNCTCQLIRWLILNKRTGAKIFAIQLLNELQFAQWSSFCKLVLRQTAAFVAQELEQSINDNSLHSRTANYITTEATVFLITLWWHSDRFPISVIVLPGFPHMSSLMNLPVSCSFNTLGNRPLIYHLLSHCWYLCYNIG